MNSPLHLWHYTKQKDPSNEPSSWKMNENKTDEKQRVDIIIVF